MDRESIWTTYEARLKRVSSYIYDHLDDDLDMDRLADIACLSPYHWHRIYRAVHGETPAATVKRLRLHRAAGEVAATTLSIRDIATRCGYPNLQSFNRIFASIYGMPPARYRREGSHRQFQRTETEDKTIMYDVTLRTTERRTVTGVAHRGSYMGIGEAFEHLFGTVFARNLIDPASQMLGIYYDDPETVDETALRSFAGLTSIAGSAPDAPLEQRIVEPGACAVLRHKGPYGDMRFAYRWLYGEWLPQSDREVRDHPVFEIYLNNPREVAPTDLLTEIWLPLK